MTHAVRTCILNFCLAVLSTGLAFTQTPSSDASPAATATAADVSLVYVGTSKGVYLYHAAGNGRLTLVSGSPFKVAGTIAGSNGKYMISLGTQYLHSYPVASSGAIKGQVSQINTKDYGGGDCGAAANATLDQSGQSVYVLINPVFGVGSCTNYQSFSVAKNSGKLTFQSFFEPTNDYSSLLPLSIPSNDQFAFATNPRPEDNDQIIVFQRQSNGALEYWNALEAGDIGLSNDNNFPWTLTAGTGNTMALSWSTVDYPNGPDFPVVEPMEITSYTVDSGGGLNSNTLGQALTPDVGPTVMSISPSGKLLAVGGGSHQATNLQLILGPNGLEVYHFNGADPITPYTKPLNDASIEQIHWDNNDHLYALSEKSNMLYVYTVTPTSFSQALGSPYKINGSANALVVVSNSCGAPASAGVTICVPSSGSSISSPVLVEAAAKVTGTMVNMQLWVDGAKKYTSAANSLTTSVSLTAGTHRFAVVATNTAGQKWEKAVNATVK